jgi:hypothetical protein
MFGVEVDMPTASVTLPDGSVIKVDGSVDEVERILRVYAENVGRAATPKSGSSKLAPRKSVPRKSESAETATETPNYHEIVNKINDCEAAEAIAEKILDKKDVLNRVLLPLYIVHEYFDDKWGLSSGDVAKILADLKIKVDISNASKKLSGPAKGFLQSDGIRKRGGGGGVRYRLNRRGIKHFENFLNS